MGNLQAFNIAEIQKEYNLSYFVETGTLYGETLDYVKQFGFDKLFSMEIMPSLYEACVKKYKEEQNVRIYLGDTSKDFGNLLVDIPLEERVLFWLDAHFPGAEGCGLPYGFCADTDQRIPLKKELEQIKNNRNIDKDYFIIDDLRVYEDGDFQDGSWSDSPSLGGDGISFIESFFKDTHTIHKDYRNQGYILGVPK